MTALLTKSNFRVIKPNGEIAWVFTSGTQGIELDGLTNLRVLALDDSSDTVEMLKALSTDSGAAVAAATAGTDALRIVAETDFDVIVSDISMPDMDGFEFLRNVKSSSRNAKIPVVALTGFGRTEDVERARAPAFITKPLDFDLLIETLRNMSSQKP